MARAAAAGKNTGSSQRITATNRLKSIGPPFLTNQLLAQATPSSAFATQNSLNFGCIAPQLFLPRAGCVDTRRCWSN